MTATAHALVGGTIAASVYDPILGITLAAISHPLLDMVPHWDFGWGWKKKTKIKLLLESLFDLGLGCLLVYLLFGSLVPTWYLIAAVFVSEMWDMAEAPYWFLNWRFPPFSWIYKIQSRTQGRTASIYTGILTQVVSVVAIYFLLQNISL